MGDSNNNNRPLSPHLDIYQYQITWTVSIMHRLTGIAMMVGLLLITAWFLSAAFSKELFLVIDNFLSNKEQVLFFLSLSSSLLFLFDKFWKIFSF